MRPPITSWLVDALYFQPDFHQAYRLPEGTAHAVDFGAGGTVSVTLALLLRVTLVDAVSQLLLTLNSTSDPLKVLLARSEGRVVVLKKWVHVTKLVTTGLVLRNDIYFSFLTFGVK